MDTPSGEDIIHAKALDAISHLMASYEAGMISTETFRVGVETVWTCCGGACKKPEFEELMQEANVYASKLPVEPKLTVMRQNDALIVLERDGSTVRLVGARNLNHGSKSFDLESDAVTYVRRVVDGHVKNGWVVV
jgi:hypothetical protein